jgi:hypothetical protein
MIGVVLWRNASKSKAVIWCEDQADLAVLNQDMELASNRCAIDVGDVVQFDVAYVGRNRIARNISHLMDNWGRALPDALDRIPDEPNQVDTSHNAEIVPIRPWIRVPEPARERTAKRRLG